MFLYKFEIDKNMCFAQWAQSLVEWNWYFDQKERDKWVSIVGELNKKEIDALNSLKKILQEEDNAYLWLWNRYLNKPIDNFRENEKWNEIKKSLQCKFEIIWQSEYPKLLAWKKELEDINFGKFRKDFKNIYNFFGLKEIQNINVALCFGWGRVSGGHAKKEFPNKIILTISNSDINNKKRVFKTLFHENVHLIEYASNKDILFRKSYEKKIRPLNLPKQKYSWRHWIVEIIIYSIVGGEIGFLDKRVNEDNEISGIKDIQSKTSDAIQNYINDIILPAKKLTVLTSKYLDNNKKLDQKYSDTAFDLLVEKF